MYRIEYLTKDHTLLDGSEKNAIEAYVEGVKLWGFVEMLRTPQEIGEFCTRTVDAGGIIIRIEKA